VRINKQSPFVSGSIAAVIYAVIYLITGGGVDAGLVIGSLVVGAVATAITFVVGAIYESRRRRA
jgi:VIT1/CCC1 family predicted Fe2+/Mn2+ transporter